MPIRYGPILRIIIVLFCESKLKFEFTNIVLNGLKLKTILFKEPMTTNYNAKVFLSPVCLSFYC
jgi:hypothetical protein